MIGFELKSLIVTLLIISIIINFMTYEEKWSKKKLMFGFIEISAGKSPKNRFWYLLVISISLFICGLYLNDIDSIILF